MSKRLQATLLPLRKVLLLLPVPLLPARLSTEATHTFESSVVLSRAEHGHTTIVRCLIGASADVNAELSDGTNALALARDNGHEELAEILAQVSGVSGSTVQRGGGGGDGGGGGGDGGAGAASSPPRQSRVALFPAPTALLGAATSSSSAAGAASATATPDDASTPLIAAVVPPAVSAADDEDLATGPADPIEGEASQAASVDATEASFGSSGARHVASPNEPALRAARWYMPSRAGSATSRTGNPAGGARLSSSHSMGALANSFRGFSIRRSRASSSGDAAVAGDAGDAAE